jgi:hypothetical protein
MARKNSLSDDVYEKELDRMRMLKRFPEMPSARQETIRVMRRITSESRSFLHELITFFVDNAERCPTPHELIERAGIMRATENKPLGDPACLRCTGTGYVRGTRMVTVPGMEPYEADYSARCACAPVAPQAALEK